MFRPVGLLTVQRDRSNRRLALIATAAIILFNAIYFSLILPTLNVSHFDEFFTLARASGIAESGDWWVIRYNGESDFNKPPLQYWIGALLKTVGVDLYLGLTSLSLFFGLALLFATGVLAYAVSPNQPFSIPLSVLLVSSSSLLWSHATKAMLDTGSAFFLTLAIASFILATRRPGWWVVVGLSVGIGYLQKGPAAVVAVFAMGFAALILGGKFRSQLFRSKGSSFFVIGTILGGLLIVLWPLLQIWQFGAEYLQQYYSLVFGRFEPKVTEGGQGIAINKTWVLWLIYDSVLWLVCLAVAAMVPLSSGFRRQTPVMLVLSVLALFCVLFTFAGGKVYARYLLQILPLLAVLLAVFAFSLKAPKSIILAGSMSMAVIAGNVYPDMRSRLEDRWGPHAQAARDFAAQIQEDEVAIYCVRGLPRSLPSPAMVYYASLPRKILHLTEIDSLDDSVVREALKGPHRGFCHSSFFPKVQEKLAVRVLDKLGVYLVWVKQ